MEKRIGVVFGRFQVPHLALHPGYRALLAYVARVNEGVVVVLGEAVRADQRTSVDIRTGLIQAWEGVGPLLLAACSQTPQRSLYLS
ncbi:MAG: hypothetical protein ACRYFV_22595 [Janthinobacterium lividum]|jgi:nicotinamide mononucleotide adenylyltransferase